MLERRKIIREQKGRSASITNTHFFPSNYYLWKVLRIVISFKLPSFLGQLLSFEVFTTLKRLADGAELHNYNGKRNPYQQRRWKQHNKF